MEFPKNIPTPTVSDLSLSAFLGDAYKNASFYRNIVDALQYTSLTRLNISFTVNKVCQSITKPLVPHWLVVKCILHYLQGTMYQG